MRKIRLLAVALLSLALALAAFGCAAARGSVAPSSAPEDPKTLVVGCDDFPPFTYIDEAGTVTGVDVDIITEACRRIGYQANCTFIDWEAKDSLLAAGDIDFIASCFSMSGRESRYRWAGPYMTSRQVVAVSPGSDIQTLDDLDGKVVAVRSTTKAESSILDEGNDIASNVGVVYSFADRSNLIPALLKGYVDAIASHEASILQYEKDYGVDLRVLDEPLFETGVGFAFDLNDGRGIAEALAAALSDMKADGTMEQILANYFEDPASYLDMADTNDAASADDTAAVHE